MMNGSSTFSTSSGSSSLPSSTSTSSTSTSSFGRRPKKLLGSFGLANGDTFNWVIPPFPEDSTVKVKEEIEVKQFSNRGSQVEDRDWALLEVEQNGFAFDLCSDVNSSIGKESSHNNGNEIESCDKDDESIFTREYVKSRSELRIDRSTYFDGFTGYYGDNEKVEKLANEFPLADGAHIEEVLNACHGDYHWAFNLLSQFNEEHFTNAATSSAISNKVNNFNDPLLIQDSSCLSSYSSPATANLTNEISSDTITERFHELDITSQLISTNLNQQNTPFTFYLDPAFADKLQSSFGQVLKEDEIDEKYLRVECSEEFARLVHYMWVKAYSSLPKNNHAPDKDSNAISSNSNSDKILNLFTKSAAKAVNTNCVSSKKESTINANKQMPYEPKSAFQEIMDLEMAINLSRKEFKSSQLNQSNSKHAISTKLKRECLRSCYPGLDEKALEELFEANDYRIKETIESIDDTLGIQTTITPEVDELIREESGSSLNYSEALVDPSNRPISSSSLNGDTLNKLRAQMNQCIEKKKELSEKGNTAFRAKMYAVASYYKSQAQEYDRKISDLRSQIIETVISTNPSTTLDLHGVHTNEVLTTLGNYLSQKFDEISRRKLNKLRLFIITGRGAHSSNGPRLKPLVINYLKQKRYRHEIINPGVITVTIP